MNRAKMFKKLIAGVMATAMVVTSIVVMPKEAKAAVVHTTEEGIKYVDDYKMADYWNSDSTKRTAPTIPGYFFGGWYTTTGNKTFTAVSEEDGLVDDAVAKFVPSYVMSVKAQNAADTQAGDGETSIRVVSAVDSDDYQKVGFKILLNNTIDMEKVEGAPLETTKGYEGLVANGKVVTSQNLFGKAAKYMMVWRLNEIADENDSLIINVTPYWITKDGTKVEGLTKYVHVEDGYEGYVSVPINLCDNSVMMAAGLLTMAYNNEVLKLEDVEYGVFDEDKMEYSDKGDSIKFVGNAAEVNKNIAADGIYANLRFSIKEGSDYKGAGTGNFLTFEVNGEQFCDWDEDLVDVDAWDIQY